MNDDKEVARNENKTQIKDFTSETDQGLPDKKPDYMFKPVENIEIWDRTELPKPPEVIPPENGPEETPLPPDGSSPSEPSLPDENPSQPDNSVPPSSQPSPNPPVEDGGTLPDQKPEDTNKPEQNPGNTDKPESPEQKPDDTNKPEQSPDDSNKPENGGNNGSTSVGGNVNINNGTINIYPNGSPEQKPVPPKPITLSNTAKVVLGLANSGVQTAQYLNSLSDIRKRTGDLRLGAQEGGYFLARGGSDKFNSFDQDSTFKYGGATFGYDALISNDTIIGANFTYLTGKAKLSEEKTGGSAKSKNISGSVYATWFDQKGNYFDLVGTLGHFRNDLNARMIDGVGVKGNYKTFGAGVSAEYGRKIIFGEKQDWFVEPQAHLSYFWIKGKSFSMSNGMKVQQEDASSLTGRLGAVVGKDIRRESGLTTQLYFKAGVNHEFMGKNKIKLNGETFKGSGLGTRAYVGFGVDSQISKNAKVFAQVEHESGSKFKSNINARVGVKYSF